MDIKLTITQAKYDILNSYLRDDLTPEQWLKESLDGKIYRAERHADPVKILERDKAGLQSQIDVLENELAN